MDKEILFLYNLVAFITSSIQNSSLWSYLLCRLMLGTTSLVNLKGFGVELSITKLAWNSFLFISMSRFRSLLNNCCLWSFLDTLINWLILLYFHFIPTKWFALGRQHSFILIDLCWYIYWLIDNIDAIFIDLNDWSFDFFLFARSKMIS